MKKDWLIRAGLILLIFFVAACATTNKEDEIKKKKKAEASRNLGEAYLKDGNYTAALRELKKAEALDPSDYYLQYDLGLTYYSKQHYDLAIEHFKKSIEIKHDFAPAINSLGNCHAAKEEWDEAIFYYKQVISNLLYVTPHFPLSNLGAAYYYKKEYRLSEKYYLDALKLSPEFVNALRGLARTYVAMGRVPEAVKRLEKAADLAPTSPNVQFELGNAYRKSWEYPKALAAYEKVVVLAPDSTLAEMAQKEAEKIKKLY